MKCSSYEIEMELLIEEIYQCLNCKIFFKYSEIKKKRLSHFLISCPLKELLIK